MKKYPYQNRELDDLRGEIWEDIPWLDGYCRVSNFGRVKRLAIDVQTSNSVRRFGEKILSSECRVIQNRSVQDNVYALFGSIRIAGVRYNFSLARLVYLCFVRPFDYFDYSLLVIAKDGDGRNIQPENLQLVNHSTRSKRMFERKRHRMALVNSYLEFTQQGLTTSSNPHCKQVSQYSPTGKKIKTFPSIEAASKTLLIPACGIDAVLKERQVLSHGWGWAYGRAARLDIAALREKGRISFVENRGQPVTQYNAKGKRLAIYPAIEEAARATGVGGPDISTVLSGRQRSAGGFIWKRGRGKERIDVSNYLIGEAWRAKRQQKKVRQYRTNGKYIRTFESVKAAAASVGINAATISGAIKGKTTAAGYKWRFGA